MKRILIVNPYGIGDVLFMTPLLKALKEQTDVECVDVLLGSRTEAVLKGNPNVDRIYVLDKDKLSRMNFFQKAWYLFGFYSRLRKNRYNVFFDLSLTREYAFFAKFFLFIPKRIGFNYKNRGKFLNFREDLSHGYESKKVAQYYVELLRFLNINIPEKLEMDFFVANDVLRSMENILRQKGILRRARLAVVSAGGGESWGKDAHFKQWPTRFFRELLEKINLSFPLDAVLFVGGPKDAELNQEVSQGLSVPHHHFAGQLSLEETAACLKLSRFGLFNEGGLYHMASALKVPVITLVGPVNEQVYGAVGDHSQLLISKENLTCRPCYQRFRYNAECETVQCLENLTPEEVYRKILGSRFLHQLEK